MQSTTNYNLNIVEGTDVVNPLTQFNPNFTAIDTAMFANKQASIGSATELTSGTVHTITRLNPNSNYIKFTATSNWNLGDSMSVDGTTVSVYLPDGTAPSTGCYVINSEVFMILNGTRATLYVSPVPSLDSLSNTSITTPADGESLVFDGTVWANKQLTAANVPFGGRSIADALNAGLINYVKVFKATNASSISLDMSDAPGPTYPLVWVLTVGKWNEAKGSVAIGWVKDSAGSAAGITVDPLSVVSAASISNHNLGVTLNTDWSYASLAVIGF